MCEPTKSLMGNLKLLMILVKRRCVFVIIIKERKAISLRLENEGAFRGMIAERVRIEEREGKSDVTISIINIKQLKSEINNST